MGFSKDHIVNSVRTAGLVGAGGAGFPTYVKMQAQAEIVIANGSECEPLLHTDKTLMKENAYKVVEGMKIAMEAVGAREGIIGIKGVYTDVIEAIEKELPSDGTIYVHKLENYYPAGDEFLLVYDTTKRIIPEGGIPLNVGVVVNNVLTLAQMSEAVSGKPVTRRLLTINGEVFKPVVLNAPVGMTYRELIRLADPRIEDYAVIDGGPMMGRIITDLEAGISKTTSGILVLPDDHFLVTMSKESVPSMVKKSKAACCQCFRCSDVCPRNLLGHELYPHKTMRTIDYSLSDMENAKHVTSAFLCSQCGCCELVGCDVMKLSPRKIYGAYRKELATRGVKNPHHNKPEVVREGYHTAKISTAALVKKINISEYYHQPVESVGEVDTNKVRIRLNAHIGAPALPSVAMGFEVKMGDVIAATPTASLGSIYHASIAGKVTDVNDSFIEISRDY